MQPAQGLAQLSLSPYQRAPPLPDRPQADVPADTFTDGDGQPTRHYDRYHTLFEAQLQVEKTFGRGPTGYGTPTIPAPVVAEIWQRSGLPSARLREIYEASDPRHRGALDCEGFVAGMAAIDDDLRRLARMRSRRRRLAERM